MTADGSAACWMAWMAAATLEGWLVTASEPPHPKTPANTNSPAHTLNLVFMAVNLSHFNHIHTLPRLFGPLLIHHRLDCYGAELIQSDVAANSRAYEPAAAPDPRGQREYPPDSSCTAVPFLSRPNRYRPVTAGRCRRTNRRGSGR